MPGKNTQISLNKSQGSVRYLPQLGTVEDLITSLVARVGQRHAQLVMITMTKKNRRIDSKIMTELSNWDAEIAAVTASQLREMLSSARKTPAKTEFRRRRQSIR